MYTLRILVILIGFGTIGADRVQASISVGDSKVTVEDVSGSVSIDGVLNSSVKIRFLSIVELDTDEEVIGNAKRPSHGIPDFSSETFNISAPSEEECDGSACKSLRFFKELAFGPSINCIVKVFNATGSEFSIGDVLYEIDVENWTYCQNNVAKDCKMGKKKEGGFVDLKMALELVSGNDTWMKNESTNELSLSGGKLIMTGDYQPSDEGNMTKQGFGFSSSTDLDHGNVTQELVFRFQRWNQNSTTDNFRVQIHAVRETNVNGTSGGGVDNINSPATPTTESVAKIVEADALILLTLTVLSMALKTSQ